MEQSNFEKLTIGVDKRKKPIFIGNDVRNQHIAILGSSGTGKSTAAMSLLLQKYAMGETIITLNWRRCLTLENILPEFRANYLENRISINVAKDGLKLPLCDRLKNLDGKVESETSVQHRLSSMLTVAGGLTPTQSAVVGRAVEVIYNENLFHTEGIRSVKSYLEAQEQQTALNAAGRLRALCDENYVQDGDFLQDNNRKIFEINLSELQYDDQTVVARFFLDFLLRRANQGDFVKNKITLFVDECQNLNFRPDSTMATLLNESRKLGVTLILAAPKIITGTRGMSVVQQCGTTLYFSPEASERRKIAKQINPQKVDEYTFQLSRLKVGEYIVCSSLVDENDKQLNDGKKLSTYVFQIAKVAEDIPMEDSNGCPQKSM